MKKTAESLVRVHTHQIVERKNKKLRKNRKKQY